MEVPCGLVINRDRDEDEEMAQYIREENLEVLMRVPERRSIAEAYSSGNTLLSANDEWLDELLGMFERIAEVVVSEPATPSA
jgi:MinD superfamily P-loop ATPase